MSVVDLCERIDDSRELRLELLGELRRLAPFDAFAWLLTDPSSEVGAAPIADVPCLADLPRLIRLKYATEINRWTQQPEPVARLHAVTDGELERSLVWRELLRDHGVSDVVSIVFRDRFGCWAFLDLWRYVGVFTDAEARVLAAHVETITSALRRCTLRTFSPSTHSHDHRSWPGAIVLVLSPQLEVQGLALEADIDDHQPIARVHLREGEWLTLRAARISTDIAVSIERASPTDRLDLLRRSAGLTPRETELLHLLATGTTPAPSPSRCSSRNTPSRIT